ncbi:hypothetical protein EYF80_018505 [Liparis tanakae]|uniref:Uncharacterized protein n=1 Tax=Liparis tanakae TaxID=230148 RepID=A0A4Z2I234_9TELE|nr:hypothetical protein EYF80_018505 [Liparis tanakae]
MATERDAPPCKQAKYLSCALQIRLEMKPRKKWVVWRRPGEEGRQNPASLNVRSLQILRDRWLCLGVCSLSEAVQCGKSKADKAFAESGAIQELPQVRPQPTPFRNKPGLGREGFEGPSGQCALLTHPLRREPITPWHRPLPIER